MDEKADLECSGRKGGQYMFLRIRLYKILIANDISAAVEDTGESLPLGWRLIAL